MQVFPTIPSPTAVILNDLNLLKSLEDDFWSVRSRGLSPMVSSHPCKTLRIRRYDIRPTRATDAHVCRERTASEGRGGGNGTEDDRSDVKIWINTSCAYCTFWGATSSAASGKKDFYYLFIPSRFPVTISLHAQHVNAAERTARQEQAKELLSRFRRSIVRIPRVLVWD